MSVRGTALGSGQTTPGAQNASCFNAYSLLIDLDLQDGVRPSISFESAGAGNAALVHSLALQTYPTALDSTSATGQQTFRTTS